MRTLLLSVVILTGLAPAARSASPALGTIHPRGGQRGTETTLVLGGARLSDAKELMWYTPGFTTTKLTVVNDTQIKATVKIAADCKLGEHALRLRTATGLSDLRTFWVGALPVVDEKEPNSEFATAQPIPLNVTVHGVTDNEDVDYYKFEAKKGQRVTAVIEATRLGNLLFDPYVAILDGKRFELGAADDSPLVKQDSIVSVVIPADGAYYVQVRDSAYGGNGACQYRLHVGTFPQPLGMVPAGGKLGEAVDVRLLGDPAGESTRRYQLPAVSQANFTLDVTDAGGTAPVPLPFRLSAFGNVIEAGPNQTHQTATPVPALPVALNGVISKPGEVDHYRFKLTRGQAFEVQCYARRLGSPLDPVVSLALANNGPFVANDDNGGPDSAFTFTAPQDGDYVLAVTDHLGKGGPTYFYRVEIAPPRPTLALRIPSVGQYSQERQTIVVPRGNRFATLFVAGRNFGGLMPLGATKLPPGVTAAGDPIEDGRDTVPVIFEAAADAPLGGMHTDFTGRPADPKQTFHGGFHEQAVLVTGPGQSIWWKYDVEQLAVVVTEEAPFTVEIVQPKVPLVLGGGMRLKVVATRKPGFKAPITVHPVFVPPGVGASPAVTIPEGQTETHIPVNAAGNAPTKPWRIVVNAHATVNGGELWVASHFATLEVAKPFVRLALERGAVEQGKETELFGKVSIDTPFDGPARARLYGLPVKVTANELSVTKDTKELSFKVTVDKTSPPGVHRNVFCNIVVMKNGEPIEHNLGATELRIDVPLPPKVAAAPPPPTPTPTPAAKPVPPPPAPPAPPRRLTRLEKLRLEQEEREKAAAK